MLTHLHLKNFRVFRDELSVPLSRLTLVVGPNASGKSTLLRGLLMATRGTDRRGRAVSQTLHSSLTNATTSKRAMELGVDVAPRSDDMRRALSPASQFDYANDELPRDDSGALVEPLASSIGLRGRFASDKSDGRSRLALLSLSLDGRPALRYRPSSDSNQWTVEVARWPQLWERVARLWAFGLARALAEAPPDWLTLSERLDLEAERDTVTNLRAPAAARLRRILIAEARRPVERIGSRGLWPTFFPVDRQDSVWSFSKFPSCGCGWPNFASDELSTIASRLFHLGPVRVVPNAIETNRADELDPLDDAGRFAWKAIVDDRDARARANATLVRLCPGYALDVIAAPRELPELLLIGLRDRSGRFLRFSEVGFGISQIVPIAVACSDRGARTIVIEQPELHMHPGMQSAVADAIWDCVASDPDVQMIVETHSEHFLHRLFARSAEHVATGSWTSPLSMIWLRNGVDCRVIPGESLASDALSISSLFHQRFEEML